VAKKTQSDLMPTLPEQRETRTQRAQALGKSAVRNAANIPACYPAQHMLKVCSL